MIIIDSDWLVNLRAPSSELTISKSRSGLSKNADRSLTESRFDETMGLIVKDGFHFVSNLIGSPIGRLRM